MNLRISLISFIQLNNNCKTISPQNSEGKFLTLRKNKLGALQETIAKKSGAFFRYWETIEMGIFRKNLKISPIFAFYKITRK
jgi:hypothetical protein